MAKNDNLSDFMTDIADAIRAKKGTSEPINAQDFSSEIASIETGGGGSTMEYWRIDDAEKFKGDMETIFPVFALSIKFGLAGRYVVTLSGGLTDSSAWELIVGFSVDRNLKVLSTDGSIMTVGDFLNMVGIVNFEYCTQITEEGYYSNN